MDWANPHFAEPQWLLLAVLGPIALLTLQAWSGRARKRQLALIAAPEFVTELTRSHSHVRRWIKNLMLVLGVAAAGLAMARPQWGQVENRGQSLGNDLIFILDCSTSMLATDVAPNRLERAKLAILDFVQQQGAGRVGLVAFAGQAFLQCPLTFDYSAFEDSLRAVDEKTIAVPGTDLGRALNEAFRAGENRKTGRLMILLTDGEDLEKDGAHAAESLGEQGATVFTVGVGTPEGTEIQVRNAQGQMELLRDNRGELVRSRLDETTLRKVAEATRGIYQPLGSMGEGLARIQAAVKADDLKAGPGAEKKLGIERFHFPLAIMILVLVAESLIGTRRKQGEAARALCLWLCVLSPGAVMADSAQDLPTRETFNAGSARLREGKLREAEGLLENVLQTQKEAWRVPALYNLGHTRFAQGMEELKKSEAAGPSAARGQAAALGAEEAITDGRSALQVGEVQRLVNSYLHGRGARREIRSAMKAVRQALQFHASALNRLERAAGDWKSALELDPKNADARHNAEVADRHIAKVVDSIRALLQSMQGMQNAGEELKQLMQQMKGRIPAENMPPGAPGEDEEDEEEGGKQPPMEGQETPGSEGDDRPLSAEEAGWLLEGFRFGEDRRLPMTQGAESEPRDRNRPTW